ncbi:MAG: glycosyltransferase [Frankiales bacterium]|nr:glycosyltransferase [Frankiales bacterium]
MRVLVPAWSFQPVGGVEVGVLQASRALAERGHEIRVFFEVDGPLRAQWEQFAEVHQVASMEPLKPFSMTRSSMQASRAVWNRPADVLWLNRPEYIAWAQVVSRAAGARLLVHFHHKLRWHLPAVLKSGVPHYLAVSEYLKSVYVEDGVPAERLEVLHNAVAADDYPPGDVAAMRAAREALGLPQDVRIALYYGRLDPIKGVDVLFDAWRRLAPDPSHARLVVMGSNPDPQRDLAIRANQPPDVIWLDPRADVVPVLHAADLVVAPSVWEEPFGRVLIEAMSTARPVIGSRSGGMPEILCGPMSDLLVDKSDPAGLAERISQYLDWREQRPGLGEQCAAWVGERFSFDRMVDGLEGALVTTEAASRPRVSRRG